MNIRIFTVIILAALFSHQTLAEGSIELHMNAFKEQVVKDQQGNTQLKLVKIDSAVPGDKIVYITRYHNIDQRPVDAGALINSRVPKNTHLVANSTQCDACEVEFSVNGTRFDQLENLTVAQPDGSSRAALITDVVQLRWRLTQALSPGSEGEVRYKVQINTHTVSQ